MTKSTASPKAKGQATTIFDRDFAKMVAFKAEHGHCKVPNTANYAPDKAFGHRVQEWCRYGDASPLTDEQKQQLVDLGFIFYPTDRKWNVKYEELQTLLDGGNLESVDTKKLPKSLVSWMGTQRKYYKNGLLDDDRKAKLEPIAGFLLGEDGWDGMYQKLQAFFKCHNHYNVPKGHDKELSTWIYKQKVVYKHKKMSEEHSQLLDEIGFVWSMKKIAAEPVQNGKDEKEQEEGDKEGVAEESTSKNNPDDGEINELVEEGKDEIVQNQKEEVGKKSMDDDTTDELVQDEKEEIVQEEKDKAEQSPKKKKRDGKKKKKAKSTGEATDLEGPQDGEATSKRPKRSTMFSPLKKMSTKRQKMSTKRQKLAFVEKQEEEA